MGRLKWDHLKTVPLNFGSVDSEELIKTSKFTVTPTTWMHKVIRIVHMTLLVR